MWCTNRLLWHTNSDFYGVRTPPFMPYDPFLLGVGVVYNLLSFNLRPEPPFTGVSGPSGPQTAKSLKKGLFGGLEKSLKKYPKKSKNTEKIPKKIRKSVFLDFFGYFLRLFSRPKRPFLRLFCGFGPGGPGDSCKWRLGSQTKTPCSGQPKPTFRRCLAEFGRFLIVAVFG